MKALFGNVLLLAVVVHGTAVADDAKKLRLITWADYVPAEVIAQFKKETGIEVEVTLSNNEEIISKLRATGGAGYRPGAALAGPHHRPRSANSASTSRSTSPRSSWSNSARNSLDIVRKNTTLDGKLYGLPYLWGTDGLVVNTKRAKITDYPDLCRPDLKGKTAVRLRRPTLMAFAFAAGKDPFALYGDPKAYGALMDRSARRSSPARRMCKFFYDNKDQLLNGIRSGEVVAAMMWDTGGWTLNRENPDMQFIVPRSGAIGWLDTFALPARGRNDAAAYAWINFTMRPENAARSHQVGRQLLRRRGHRGARSIRVPKAQFDASVPDGDLKDIHWYPAIRRASRKSKGGCSTA